MRLVLLGAPGGGKGTQAARLKEHLNVPHISTGDLLRGAVAAGTELGLKAKAVMEAGELVSDDLVLGILEERLGEEDARVGFILDGFPRNLKQCEMLSELLDRLEQPVDLAINIEVPESVIVERIAGRAAAEGRADDNEETVLNRLKVYREQTAPVVDYYGESDKVRSIDGLGTIDEVYERIVTELG